jgi:nucleoside-diphosphate-sugar epimerase
MSILITGGAGYIGSILVPTLLAKGHEVTVIDNLLFRQTALLDCCASSKFHFIRGDVRDEALMRSETSKHDVIIPLAAIVGAPASNRDLLSTQQINFDSVKSLVNMLSRQQMVFYPTTNSGYGVGQKGVYCDETTPLNPLSAYGRTKVEAEKILLDSGLAVTFRLATVFGAAPRMRMDLLVNDFVYRAFADRFVVLFESHFKRNFIHIRDIANVFLFAMANYERMKGEPYNVGLSDANLSKMELCLKIKEYLPDFHIVESEIGKDPDKRDYIVSNVKIELLDWRPQYSLDDGINELIKTYSILTVNTFKNV